MSSHTRKCVLTIQATTQLANTHHAHHTDIQNTKCIPPHLCSQPMRCSIASAPSDGMYQNEPCTTWYSVFLRSAGALRVRAAATAHKQHNTTIRMVALHVNEESSACAQRQKARRRRKLPGKQAIETLTNALDALTLRRRRRRRARTHTKAQMRRNENITR